MGNKVKLLKKLDININEFFPEKSDEKITKYFNGNFFQRIIKSLIYKLSLFNVYLNTLERISPFIISLICLILSF